MSAHCTLHTAHCTEFGVHTPVCVTNLVQYVELVKDFWLDTGIRAQAEAFRAGVRDFFPA